MQIVKDIPWLDTCANPLYVFFCFLFYSLKRKKKDYKMHSRLHKSTEKDYFVFNNLEKVIQTMAFNWGFTIGVGAQ